MVEPSNPSATPSSPVDVRSPAMTAAIDDLVRQAGGDPEEVSGQIIREAVQTCLRLGRDKPDLMILDIKIPLVDGVEVCRQIKADPKNKTAIIAISGQADTSTKAIEAGADSFISKPLDLEALLAQVKKLLQVM